jgi:hypothetical protein
VTGRVFEAAAGIITLCNGWTRGPRANNGTSRWETAGLAPVIEKLIAEAPAREKAVN